MPQITFRGKTYYSEFEMPSNIRLAYQKDQLHKSITKSRTDVEDIHRRAQRQAISSPQTSDLPAIEELYKRLAPEDRKPLSPAIDPEYSTVVPESSLVIRGLVFGILWSLIIIAVIFLLVRLIW